jgi:hypothetical protein
MSNQPLADSDLLKTAKNSLNKLMYLDGKIVKMMNHNYRMQMMQGSNGSRTPSAASF